MPKQIEREGKLQQGPPLQTENDFDPVWREQSHEFIIGFAGEEERRQQIKQTSLINNIADSDSEDEESSGILPQEEDSSSIDLHLRTKVAIVEDDDDDGHEEPFFLRFFSGGCTSQETDLGSNMKHVKDQKLDGTTTQSSTKEGKRLISVVTPPTAPVTPCSCSSNSADPACPLPISALDTPSRREPDIILNSPSHDLLDVFPSCTSMNHVAKSLFEYDEIHPPMRLRKSGTDQQRNRLRLAEDYGPIRRELPCSSRNSEATTDPSSNVTFAKLASTLITSQGSKKFVEPLDRIATLLELKGVGRGTSSIQQVREASTLRLHIDEYSEANFWPLLDSLYFNLNLQKLVLFRHRHDDQQCQTRTIQEMDCLFRVLNRLASSLSEIHLWGISPEDQIVLSRGLLANNASLEYVQIHLESGSLSPLLARTLTRLPNLVSLEVEVTERFPLSLLLDCPTLTVLSVICKESTRFMLPDEEVVKFSEKLKENKVLQVLSIDPFISSAVGLPAILTALRSENYRGLDTLQFSSAPFTSSSSSSSSLYPEEEVMDTTLEIILDLLGATSLRVLWNNCYESWVVSPQMQQRVLHFLSQNRSMEQFHVFVESNEYWTEKCNILEKPSSSASSQQQQQYHHRHLGRDPVLVPWGQ